MRRTATAEAAALPSAGSVEVPTKATASIFASVMNLLNNIVGAGLYSMPWVLMEASVLSGSVLTCLICALNLWSFLLLADACELTGTFSYLELGSRAFGPRFGQFSQIVCVCYTFGSLVSYVVLAGDCLVGAETGVLSLWLGSGSFFGGGSTAARAAVVYALGVVGFVPLSMPRTIDALKYASYAAFLSTLLGAGVVVHTALFRPAAAFGDDDDVVAGPPAWAGFTLGVWQAVPIVNVAFTAHYNGPRFYYELRDRSRARFRTVCGWTMGLGLVVYLSVAIAGYLAFRAATVGDVLEDFNSRYALAVGVRASLLVILLAVFPKVCHSNRDGLSRLLWDVPADDLPRATYVALTLAICFCVLTLGAVCTKIEVVLAYKGGIFGSLMVYVIPPLVNTAARMDADKGGRDGADAHLDVQLLGGPAVRRGDHSVLAVLRRMFASYRASALLFTWGVVSGTLAVAVTVLHQSGVLK